MFSQGIFTALALLGAFALGYYYGSSINAAKRRGGDLAKPGPRSVRSPYFTPRDQTFEDLIDDNIKEDH